MFSTESRTIVKTLQVEY